MTSKSKTIRYAQLVDILRGFVNSSQQSLRDSIYFKCLRFLQSSNYYYLDLNNALLQKILTNLFHNKAEVPKPVAKPTSDFSNDVDLFAEYDDLMARKVHSQNYDAKRLKQLQDKLNDKGL